MDNPEPAAVSRTEAWLRNHEEWAAPNDDLRSKVIRSACSAQAQANEQAQGKSRSQWILVLCIIFCGGVTWILQDSALALDDPQASALMAAADDGWTRPIELHAKILENSGNGFSYDWSLAQAHITWRTMLYQRFARALCE